MSSTIERKLAAIMFTDIVGYTAQMSKDEAVAITLLNKKESILKPLIKEHNGTYVKSTGDGSLSHFKSAVDAAMCAKKLQESIYDDKDLNVRVGVHLGDTIFEKGDVRGEGVNIASRLESMAVEGGVFVSKEVHDQLSNQIEFDDVSLGLQSMKGVGRLIEVFGLKGEKLTHPNPKEYKENRIDKHSNDEIPSIAIIPFDNKGSEEDDFYAYGISTDIISDCSSAGLIRVAGIKEVEELGNISFKEKAKKLFVRYVATGSLWKMNNIFQLSIELYDTKDNKVVWSDRWQEKWEELPTIKMNLSDGLLKTLSTNKIINYEKDYINPEAYEYYLKGKHAWEKRKNVEDIEIARGLLLKSIELDNRLLISKNKLAWIEIYSSDTTISKKMFLENLKEAKESKNYKEMSAALTGLGCISHDKKDKKNAIKYHTESLEISKKINCKNGEAASLCNLGIAYSMKKDFVKALSLYKEGLNIFDKINEYDNKSNCLNNISLIYSWQKKYEKAIDYSLQSYQLDNKYASQNKLGKTSLNLSKIYYRMHDYTNSLKYALKAYEIGQQFKDADGWYKEFIVDTHFHLASIYDTIGEYNKTVYNYKMGADRYVLLHPDDKEEIAHNSADLGLAYYKLKDYKQAIEEFKSSLSFKNHSEGCTLSSELEIFINLTYKKYNKKYETKNILTAIKDMTLNYEQNFYIYELLENNLYLKNAYNHLKKEMNNMSTDLSIKFLNYPYPKRIVEEYNKVFKK